MESSKGEAASSTLELWGGAECTIARTGDFFRDQAQETGHRARRQDIDLIADLGVSCVRFPVLWESIAPDRPDELDFSWTDDRLAVLRERGIKVVAGLLHHGSGPRRTNLLDPSFPQKLGEYAARVAERYPWIDCWTPVNEPLTTARFSGLYGHWYPHKRSNRAFLRALINQCLGTAEAMKAVRAINPAATLLQTEDLGKSFSTDRLRYQAAYENERRWLSFDLLSGKVGRRHYFYRRLIAAGIKESELERLASGEARPDLLGINHYLTSERFLDHRTELYPHIRPGGNGRHSYVDAEAVRVKRLGPVTGPAPRLREAWQRYGLPMAITEVHHGCTRDEQLRWFAEVWEQASHIRREGIDLRAVTFWSLFGNADWRSLLTRQEGIYDVGAFDTRSSPPRPTAIACAAKSYARGEKFDHPALDVPGWWKRPERLYGWHSGCRTFAPDGRKLLITGATGTLGRAFARICERRGLSYCLTDRNQLDIGDQGSVEAALERHQPWAIINTAGFVRVAEAEAESEACFRENAVGPSNLARACAGAGIPLVTFSSDLVFDGLLGRPYVESDLPNPASVYGQSKAQAEREVLAACPHALVVRTSAFFGPWDRYNFAWNVLAQLGRSEPVLASRKNEVSPTFVPDLVHASLDLLIDGETGIWHLANQGRLSWHRFAQLIAEGAGYDPSLVLPIDTMPASSTILSSERGTLLRPVEPAIRDYLRDVGEWVELPTEMNVAAE